MTVWQAGIVIAAHVIPGPAIKAAVLNMRGVVGNEIVAERVAFVRRRPKFASLGIDCQSNGIANAGCEDAQARAVGIVFQNICPMKFRLVRVRIIDV